MALDLVFGFALVGFGSDWIGLDWNEYLWERCWLVVFLHFIECNMQIGQPFKSRSITIIANCRQLETIAQIPNKNAVLCFVLFRLGVSGVQVHALTRLDSARLESNQWKLTKREKRIAVSIELNWIEFAWINRCLFVFFCIPWIESAYAVEMVTKNSNEINWRQWPWLLGFMENAFSSNDF